MKEDEILEQASQLCHIEWIEWSKSISNELRESVKVLENNIQYLKDIKGIDDEKRKILIAENTRLAHKITDRLNRWESLWIDYDNLSEEMKEYDRIYARKILELKNK